MKLAGLALIFATALIHAQGTFEDYQRAQGLQAKARGLVVNVPGTATWIDKSDHFWYPRSVKGGTEFLLVDAVTAAKKPAFDHDKLAAAINQASGGKYTGLTLPFAPTLGGRGGGGRGGAAGATPTTAPLAFVDNEQAITFGAGGSMYNCKLTDYTCTKNGPIPADAGFGGRGRGAPQFDENPDQPMPMEVGGDPEDGLEWQPFPQQGAAGGANGRGESQPPCAPARQTQTGGRGGRAAAPRRPTRLSPRSARRFSDRWPARRLKFARRSTEGGTRSFRITMSS